MSNLFGKLTNEGLEESQDRLGGGGVWPTDIYTGTIKLMYAGKAKSSNAQFVAVHLESGGKELRQTIYVTDKEGKQYFLNKDDKTKKVPLPGFTIINDICLATLEKPLAECAFEEKVVKLYNFEAKKEEPTNVMVLVEALGKTVSLGVLQVLENKNEKQGDEYVPTAETRDLNEIDKVFHTETKMTLVEAANGKTEGEFWDKWLEKNKGQVRDKRKIKDGQGGKAVSKGPPTGGESKPAAKSLFGKK